MSRWKLLDNWEKDIPGLTDEQLRERLQFARLREARSDSPGLGRSPKARRLWREKASAVLAEMDKRGLLP